MKDFKENQIYTNDGIFALCSVVKELVGPSQKTNKPNPALHLLDKFLFRSPQLPMHRNAVSTFTTGCCYVQRLWPYMLLCAWCCSCVKTISCICTCNTTRISRLLSWPLAPALPSAAVPSAAFERVSISSRPGLPGAEPLLKNSIRTGGYAGAVLSYSCSVPW